MYSSFVVDNLLLYYIYFEMLLVSTSTLNQLTIVGVGIDRMMNQPLTQTRLRLPPTKKGGVLKKSSTLGDISPNTHSDLRGGYEADHSDTSDDSKR